MLKGHRGACEHKSVLMSDMKTSLIFFILMTEIYFKSRTVSTIYTLKVLLSEFFIFSFSTHLKDKRVMLFIIRGNSYQMQ